MREISRIDVVTMNKTIKYIMLALLLTVLPQSALAACNQTFPDVLCDYWAYDYIQWAYDIGIINGYTDGTFHPDAPITRAEMIVMLWRLNNPTLTPTPKPTVTPTPTQTPIQTSIKSMIEGATAGQTIDIPSGTYNERIVFQNSGTSTNPITITTIGNVVFDGQDTTDRIGNIAFDLKGQSYITISNIVIKNYGIGIDTNGFPGVNGITIDNVTIDTTGSSAIQFSNFVRYSSIKNSHVKNNGYNSIALYGTFSNKAYPDTYTHHINIENNLIEGAFGHSAIDLFGDLEYVNIIGNNIVGDSTGGGMFTHTTPDGLDKLASHINISYNVINGSANAWQQKGMYIELNDSIVSYNTIYGRSDESAIYGTLMSNNVTYKNNTIYNNYFGIRVPGNNMYYLDNEITNNAVDYVFDVGTYTVRLKYGTESISNNGATVTYI